MNHLVQTLILFSIASVAPAFDTPLENYETEAPRDWAVLREAQLQTLSLPNTGMAVTIDLGHPTDVHPKGKLDVGQRLALAARKVAYGEDIVFSGPIYDSMKVDGNKVRLRFKNVGSGLTMGVTPWMWDGSTPAKPEKLTGFAIAGADQNWVDADAAIEGEEVVVSSDAVPAPVAVRYAWDNNPTCNLYNKEGLPASPFRTGGADEYSLSGTVSDPSQNLLPGVRVALKKAGVSTQTDGNGAFSLSFKAAQPPEADKTGIYDSIEIDKEGYIGRSIPVRDLALFAKPIRETIEPNPIGEDNVGFSVRMSMDNTVPGLPPTPDFALNPVSDWEALFQARTAKPPTGQTERVTFHAYVPKNAGKLKAAFLLSRHGIGTIDHPRLRAFAAKHGIALVGILGDPVQRGIYPVDKLDEHIARLGEMIGHPELSTVPVFTFGHSNGTGFSGIIAAQRPERVIAWISYHSGSSFHLQFPGSEKVPCLAMHGHLDKFLENGQEQTIKNLRKERNAAVGLMMEAHVGHGPVDKDQNATWDFIIAFCEAAMRTRLNADGSLRPVEIEKGWLGGQYDRSVGGMQELPIAAYAEFPGDKSTANWLPDETFARTWQQYGLTDPRAAK